MNGNVLEGAQLFKNNAISEHFIGLCAEQIHIYARYIDDLVCVVEREFETSRFIDYNNKI